MPTASTKSVSLFTEVEALRMEKVGLEVALRTRDEKIALVEEENERLREMLIKMRKQAFGPKSERWETEEQGKLILNEAEVEASKPEAEDAAEGAETEIKVAAHTKKRGHRKPLPEHLEREIVIVELPEEERFDAAGNALKVVGKEVSEKLMYEPAQIKVIEYHRYRYGADAGEPVKVAPPVPSIIPKGIATPSLIAAIVTAKYADGLPLYRQEEIFKRQEIELSRSSMARWVVQAALAARPIWNLLEERLMASHYVACDETHVQVLKEEGRKPTSKSWMWLRTNPSDTEKIILFDYDPHRSGEVAKRLLLNYEGILQCDGYGAYNAVEKQRGLTRIGCNMHGRRKFREAADGKTKSKKLAATGLKFYRALYAIEEEAKDFSWRERHAYRLEKAVPIWEEFKAWALETEKKVPRRSSIGDALHYFIAEYDYLVGYLLNGELEMDNGHAERMIKNFAIGRKNWLFSDTPEGAESSALFYSFVVTAKVNGVNPYEALKKIFTELPLATTADDFDRLAQVLLGTKS
jgi:transposase